MAALMAASDYLRRGWAPIPVGFQDKVPISGKAWEKLRLTEDTLAEHFAGERRNVGVVLGAASGDLVDVDLDHPLAVQLASLFLPPTETIFGRATKPASHWLHRVKGIESEKFSFSTAGMIVEIRGDRHQTVFPGSVHKNGETIEWVTDGEPTEYESETLRNQVARLAATVLLILHFPAKGTRDDASLALAGTLLKAGVSLEVTERYLQLIAERGACEDVEAKVRKVRQTARAIERGKDVAGISYLRKYFKKDAADTAVEWLGLLVERGPPANSECTDAANGERLAQSYQDGILYCYPWRAWHIWNGERWARDDAGTIVRYAVQTAKNVFGEARDAEGRKQQDLSRWAVASQTKARLEAMIWAAHSLVAVRPDQFDPDPWLLNIQGGTLDLRGGDLRDSDRHDLITKQGGLEYDPEARCPRWLAFLDKVMGGDADLVPFLQRAVGYTLTGETSEQCFFLLHGSGANGKSTFIEVLRRLLGSYGRPTSFKTLVDSNYGDGVSNNVAALDGLRLVTAVETNRGKRFDEALIKQLTGGDQITARFLYGEYFDFYPKFKLWLAVNHRPEIRGVDEGI